MVRRLFLVFVVSRLLLLAAGLAGYHGLPAGPALVGSNLTVDAELPAPLAIWARWDSAWYLLIAEEGYDCAPSFLDAHPQYQPEDASGFFPLYPTLIRWLTPVTGNVGAGILISNLSLLLALVLLVDVGRQLWGRDRGSRIGAAAGTALLVWPTTLFHSAVYSESLFLALSLAVLAFALRRRWLEAGILAGLATATRPFGVILALPLILEWWRERRRHRWGWLALAGPAVALGLILLTSYNHFGDALAFAHRQQRWRGSLHWPGFAVLRWWHEGPALHGAHDSTLELVAALIFLAALPAAFKKLRPSLAWYLLACLSIPLSSTLWSFGRISSAFFPIYFVAGATLVDRPLWIGRLLAGLSMAVAALAMAWFASGAWVG